jgi:hypothetical protein
MSYFSRIFGIVGSFFQIGGPGGPAVKSTGGVLEARDAADAVYAVVRVGTPSGANANDAVPEGDFLLENNPPTPGTYYENTFTGNKLTQERWKRTSDNTLIKTMDYTFTGSYITTEVRKVYAANGSTVIAQTTITRTFTVNRMTGETTVRNV